MTFIRRLVRRSTAGDAPTAPSERGCGRWRAVGGASSSANFFDFHPAVADRRLAAFFEGLAAALRIEQGKLAKGRLARKQRPEKRHGIGLLKLRPSMPAGDDEFMYRL